MSERIGTLLDRLLLRRSPARWRDLAARAEAVDLASLRSLRREARQVRREIDRLLHVADGRLALPAIGSDAIPRPPLSDWAWRPEVWRRPIAPAGVAGVASRTGFGDQLTVFHDSTTNEFTLRQIRNTRETDLAPFGLRMDVFGFDGTYLSLVIDLPEAAVSSLSRRHIIRMDTSVDHERPLRMSARLNVRHGPNTEQLVRDIPLDAAERSVEFDLAYTAMDEKRVDRAWVDLIFEGAEMNQVVLHDLTFSRRPRAEL